MDETGKNDEGFISRSFKILCQVFADFVLGGIGYFNNTGIPPLGLIGLVLGIVRLNPKYRKSKIVFFLYWLGIILSLDFIYAVGYGVKASFGTSVILALAAIYVVALIVRKVWKRLLFMTPVQLLVIPVCLLGIAAKSGEFRNSADRCENISNAPGVRILNDERHNFTKVPHTAIPRFFISRPERGDILVCAHVYIHEKDVLVKNAINRLDLKTGIMTEWHKRGNVLAIKEERGTGDIYALIQKNFRDREAPNVELIVFDPEGKILDRKDLGLNRNTFYGASVTIMPEAVYVTVEANFFAYHKAARTIEALHVAGNTGTPVYRTAWSEPYLFGTMSVSPLFGRFFNSRHLIKVNMQTRSIERWIKDYPVGTFDVQIRPGRKQLAASRNFPEGAWLLDFDLNKLALLPMPAGVREIEFSQDGRYLFGAGFFLGTFYAIAVEKNELIAETFIGNGARGMTVDPQGNVIVGASCGVVGIDVDEFLKTRRSPAATSR